MREAWTWPAYTGVLVGTALFVVLFVPALVWQFRAYGRPSLLRLLTVAAACVYVVALVAYTLLPLPTGDRAAWCAAHVADHNGDPLQMLRDIRAVRAEIGSRATLRSVVFLQVAFNVLLFVPFGVLVRVLLRWGVALTTIAALATSLVIEATQYTGVFGLIGCSYRVGDVDDAITNTAGAFLGAVLAPLVLHVVPSSSSLATERGLPRPVSVWRRWTGMALDAGAALALGAAVTVGARVLLAVGGASRVEIATAQAGWLSVVLPFVVVLVLPALLGSGASWGQRVVWLEPVSVDEHGRAVRAGRPRSLARALVVGGLWWVLVSASSVERLPDDLASRLTVAGWTLAGASVVTVAFTRRGLSGLLAGTQVVDSRERPDA